MVDYIEVARVGEIPSGTMKMVVVKDRELLLARVGLQVYCVQNRCPHMGSNLSAGRLVGTIVQCPRHGSRFDLEDGKVIRWTDWSGLKLSLVRFIKPPHPLVTYQTKLDGDQILVSVPD